MRDAFRREKSCTREPSSYNLVVGFSSRVFAGNGSGRASCAVRLYLLVFIACVTVRGDSSWNMKMTPNEGIFSNYLLCDNKNSS